jgi:hypothetical protein
VITRLLDLMLRTDTKEAVKITAGLVIVGTVIGGVLIIKQALEVTDTFSRSSGYTVDTTAIFTDTAVTSPALPRSIHGDNP